MFQPDVKFEDVLSVGVLNQVVGRVKIVVNSVGELI